MQYRSSYDEGKNSYYWGIQQKPYKETAKNRENPQKYLQILDVCFVPDTAGWIGGDAAPLTAPCTPALNILHIKERFKMYIYRLFCADLGQPFRIRINFIRTRIQHIRLKTDLDPDPIRIQFTVEKKLNFFESKSTIYLPLGPIKDVQVTEEAFSSQKRTSSTSKHEISKFFYFCGYFFLSWIRIRILNTDPDPLTWLNLDPIRIRIRIRNTDLGYQFPHRCECVPWHFKAKANSKSRVLLNTGTWKNRGYY